MIYENGLPCVKGGCVIETKESSRFSSSDFEDDKLIYSIDSVTGSIELK